MTDHDDRLERAIDELKEPVRLSSDLTARIMATIALDRPAEAEPIRWWRRRWTIEVTPWSGLAAAAALVGAVMLGTRLSGERAAGDSAPSVALAAADSLARVTQFVLVAPGAKSVAVVGDFNDWNETATPLVRSAGDGMWWVTVPLAPGRYRYAFVVDGSIWQRDPEAAAVEDEFGRPNSVVTIGGA